MEIQNTPSLPPGYHSRLFAIQNQMLKEFETDSEGGKAEIQSEEDFQALKRSRTENHVFLPSQYQLEPLNSVPHNQNMVLQRDSKFSHPSHDVDFIGTNPGCKKTDQIFYSRDLIVNPSSKALNFLTFSFFLVDL
ncbi:hypothetical protein OIU85_000908 [Salix viminalis]|uniref:Uncharacterized protein n=1 Tax=Salix viminalis TaxID=40686 RepID=A0A9Q0VL82_SALVM|nr:hypothetical protein OIU85_000908 [Salix viminalis]